MTGPDALAAFIDACIGEEETLAEAATRGPWHVDVEYADQGWADIGAPGENVTFNRTCEGSTATGDAAYIVSQQPAVTLARCAQLRAILATHHPDPDDIALGHRNPRCVGCGFIADGDRGRHTAGECPTRLGVARIYRLRPDGTVHPEWRKEWEA